MNIPFVYGRLAEADDFTGREQDILRLKQNLTGRINTTIVSPRRWGKSSLVHRTLEEIKAESDKYLTCHVDVFNCRDEESFYQAYMNAVLSAATTKMDEFVALVKKYVGSLGPKIMLADAGATMEFSLGLDFYEHKYSIDEILDLPEKIAIEKGKQMIVCIDEFQNVENFDAPVAFQARLRSHWQTHQNVCYCLYGSKKHMLLSIFADYEMPFYKFGDIIMLQKIEREVWADFIVKRFKDTGKCISKDLALSVADKVECHSYYVQQLSQLLWMLTVETASEEALDVAYQQMIDRSALLFDNIIDGLKPRQISFLVAIANGEVNFSSAAVLRRYKLGTSANIKNLRKAVLDRDLISIDAGVTSIQDPVFKQWLLMS